MVRLLRALVEHYAAQPACLPQSHRPTDGADDDPAAYRAAVAYVGGMTDRFACEQAVTMLGWSRRRPADGLRRPSAEPSGAAERVDGVRRSRAR